MNRVMWVLLSVVVPPAFALAGQVVLAAVERRLEVDVTIAGWVILVCSPFIGLPLLWRASPTRPVPAVLVYVFAMWALAVWMSVQASGLIFGDVL